MFEKTLNDLVTGIRSHRRDTPLYISNAIAECKAELKSSDMHTKSNALSKLTFLQMMGYTMSWAAFSCVEVMSSPRFAFKRVGYLAACQGLDQPDKSPVVLLTTNMLKKELRGASVSAGNGENIYHAGLAINALSNIVTEDLGRELLPELLHLLSHPSPYVRKKALLCLYKVFLKYPQGLRLSFEKIKLCLEDSNTSVVSCAVNVITELSDKNPNNYLPLAPAFFKLLTSTANNWMLIKVVKLLGSLVPQELRLARKLLEPLCNIVKTTHAKSLLYEAVYAISLCLQYVKKSDGSQPSNIPQVVDLCVDTLRGFVQDSDQNLKYLGLLGLSSLLVSQPRVLHSQSECKALILKCLSDEDVTIRTRALGLLNFMTTKRNLVELITQLLGHVEAASGQYRCELVQEIIRMCSFNKYELIVDFHWYVDVLITLAGVRGIENEGQVIARQWMDVAWRVLPVRSYAVKRSLEVLLSRGPGSAEEDGSNKDCDRYILLEILPAAAWVVGEYSHLIPQALETTDGDDEFDTRYDSETQGVYHGAIQSMTSPMDIAGTNPIPCSSQAVFIQNAMKVFAAACQRNLASHGNNVAVAGLSGIECHDQELFHCVITIMQNLVIYAESPDAEVKERAFTSQQLLLSIGLPKNGGSFSTATSISTTCRAASSTLTYLLNPDPMKPISAKAQRRKLSEGPSSPISVQEWNQDMNWDAFWFLEEETPWFDKNGAVKGSAESISFTKQPCPPPDRDDGGKTMDTTDNQQIDLKAGETENVLLGSSSQYFYTDATAASTPAPPASTRREGDPFYLNSAPPSGELLKNIQTSSPEKMPAADSRFGSIRLDSGGESDEGQTEPKIAKKKKKKARQRSAAMNVSSNIQSSLKIDFAVSDDEDDNETYQPKRSNPTTEKPGRAKEFENLALVDLTTPLGEHEVMPKNEHYVVPNRPKTQSESKQDKPKKKKKDKKKASKQSKQPEEAATGDLLGFDAMLFDPIDQNSAIQPATNLSVSASQSAAAAPPSNSISDAFDDLLGLEMPVNISIGSQSSKPHVALSNTIDKEAKKAAKKKNKSKKKQQ